MKADTSEQRLLQLRCIGWTMGPEADLIAMIAERDAEIARLRRELDTAAAEFGSLAAAADAR